MDAISLDNIDILSKWRVEIELPIMEEAPTWLEEEQHEEREEQEKEAKAKAKAEEEWEEEEQVGDTM